MFKTWLAERPQAWRDRIEVVAMDGFTGFKTAAAEELPTATAVIDPLLGSPVTPSTHAGAESSKTCTTHRGRAADPLYKARRVLHTGADLITVKQLARRLVRRQHP